MKHSFLSLIATLLILVVGVAYANDDNPGEDLDVVTNHCYWMENYSGDYNWIPAAEVYGAELSKEQCYQLDSCDGGMGMSGGGCYKWASSEDAEREPWFTE